MFINAVAVSYFTYVLPFTGSHLVPRKNPDMKRTFHFLTVFILFFMVHGQSCTLQEMRCTLGARYERAPNFLCSVKRNRR